MKGFYLESLEQLIDSMLFGWEVQTET